MFLEHMYREAGHQIFTNGMIGKVEGIYEAKKRRFLLSASWLVFYIDTTYF